jgi:hypothetical protein
MFLSVERNTLFVPSYSPSYCRHASYHIGASTRKLVPKSASSLYEIPSALTRWTILHRRHHCLLIPTSGYHNTATRCGMSSQRNTTDDSGNSNNKKGVGGVYSSDASPLVSSDTRQLSFILWKNSWISWWAQLVLSVIAGVILLFAISVTPSTVRLRSSLLGWLVACIALSFSFLSVLWTWGYARKSFKLQQQQSEESTAAMMNRLSSSVQSGILLTAVGMFFTVVAAQAIVGRLLAKVLSAGLAPSPLAIVSSGNNNVASTIQPLDIFVVQANTNILLSQWISLVFALWMARKLKAHENKNKST